MSSWVGVRISEITFCWIYNNVFYRHYNNFQKIGFSRKIKIIFVRVGLGNLFLKKWANPGLFFYFFRFPNTIFIEKNCRCQRDSNSEGEHADYSTTTTALALKTLNWPLIKFKFTKEIVQKLNFGEMVSYHPSVHRAMCHTITNGDHPQLLHLLLLLLLLASTQIILIEVISLQLGWNKQKIMTEHLW